MAEDKVVRDYSSVHTIKEMILTEIAPGYFDMTEVNTSNSGMIGLASDIAATTTEDVMNIVAMRIKESFTNTAELPETLYNRAAGLQIERMTATPSSMGVLLMISEDDILEKGETLPNGFIRFVLDRAMMIDVEGIPFALDYDIQIMAKPHQNDYIYTIIYDMSFTNGISDIKAPNIPYQRMKYPDTGERRLGLPVLVHQVTQFDKSETLINNDRINLARLSFNYTDQLAGFEVFYRQPGQTNFIQLTKRQFNTPPLKTPFFFYKVRDDRTVEITFTIEDTYFQPVFNSEIYIQYYTTWGRKENSLYIMEPDLE